MRAAATKSGTSPPQLFGARARVCVGRYAEIQKSASSREHLANARAEQLKKAEQAGASIKAPKRAEQWHANFKVRP